MKISFYPNGAIKMDDARIIYRNFSGAPSQYNRAGDRNFCVVIPTEEMARELTEAGWNVKSKPPREAGEDPLRYLPVKIKFNANGPGVQLVTGNITRQLEEPEVGLLDDIRIDHANMDIRPYDYEVNGRSGRAAYLIGIRVYQGVDQYRYGPGYEGE